MKKIFLPILAIFATLCLTSCDELMQTFGVNSDANFLSEILGHKQEKMRVVDVKFAPDYKTFILTSDIFEDIGPYQLEDTTKVRTEVVERLDGLRIACFSTPQLVKIENIEAANISKSNIRLLVLVNRTLPQSTLDRIRTYVGEMRLSFNHDNLYVAFMDSTSVSKTIKVTDYVMDNYFKRSSKHFVYLYRSILQKRAEMIQGEGVWKDASKKFLLTLSDEKVYGDNTDEPIDPDHYLYEEQMVAQDTASADSTFTAFYANILQHKDVASDHEENVLRLFCNNNGGSYLSNFKWVSCKDKILHSVHLVFPDHRFYFMNPDLKVYRGDTKELTLNFYDIKTDTLISSMSTIVVLGKAFNPIIVHGQPITYIILQGIFLTIFLLLFVYITLQVIIPYFKYRRFLRKYVISYTGRNMSFCNKPVEESCYLCKAPFEIGDEIVVKCEHTMHRSCWNENGYHCPEYSDRCKHGTHYYNHAQIFDHHNAPFYLKWILMAITTSSLAWITFILYAHHSQFSTLHSSVTQMPSFGLTIGFFLTLGTSTLALRPRGDSRLILSILLRSCIAAIGCHLSFLLINLIIYLFDINHFVFLLNWIPWTASGFIIAFCSTFSTRIVHNKPALFISFLLGFFSMYLWTLLFSHMELDFRVLLLFSFIIFGVGIGTGIATVAPRSEHYFLKVQGATKTMDIALFKWFRNEPNRIVTIGKSVDCSLQLSWDIQSSIAPVQAEIRLKKNIPYLIALEPGVFVSNKPLHINKKKRLYHGTTFVIGKSTFTYLEKDR